MKEHQIKPTDTTDWHPWCQEKSRLIMVYLAAALTCRQTRKSRAMIGYALRDAAKLFWLELQIGAGEDLEAAIVDEITDAVCRSPKDADKVLDAMVQRVKQGPRAARSAPAALVPQPPSEGSRSTPPPTRCGE